MVFDINRIVFEKAKLDDVNKLLHIIHRCVEEVNSKNYESWEIKKFLNGFNTEWLNDIVFNRHSYSVKYNGEIIGMGAVSRDASQENQSYFTAIFINPDYHKRGIGKKLIRFLEQDEWCLNSNLIEVPSSKSSHKFYHKLGYEYRTNPPVFKEDGSTIMYRYK
ncbi:GNAT family N-acetyltransferase [Clostridium sp. WILCCON 0269]|uniref:GNAT family N-acetyltransferase n=1 Tax=Candidatus Clostridium eludens TaxID=3381663 RepID=A0ABW8SEX0_9CLOT